MLRTFRTFLVAPVEVTWSVAPELLGELEPADALELHDLPLKGGLESDIEVVRVPQVVELFGRGHLEAPGGLQHGRHLVRFLDTLTYLRSAD